VSQIDDQFSPNNNRKIEIIHELIELLTIREPIDYSQYNPLINPNVTIDELSQLNASKEIEVKSLQNAWEQLEGLLFNDLQITLQEKNHLFTYLGNKKKSDKQKQKNRGRSRSHVWRAEDE